MEKLRAPQSMLSAHEQVFLNVVASVRIQYDFAAPIRGGAELGRLANCGAACS